jgi:nitrogen fixation protein FixH
MKAVIALVVAVGLLAVVAAIWIGARVKEPTVVAKPYEEGLRYDEKRKAAAASAQAARAGVEDAARAADEVGQVALDLEPLPPRAMSDLTFVARVTRQGAPLDGAAVEVALSMPGMYMGENRVALAPAGGGTYRGKGVLVRCPSGKRTWQADVEARPGDGGAPIRGRFTFEVVER